MICVYLYPFGNSNIVVFFFLLEISPPVLLYPSLYAQSLNSCLAFHSSYGDYGAAALVLCFIPLFLGPSKFFLAIGILGNCKILNYFKYSHSAKVV